jgi:hypothetical protein
VSPGFAAYFAMATRDRERRLGKATPGKLDRAESALPSEDLQVAFCQSCP